MDDNRTNYEFERAECNGVARLAGPVITIAVVAIIACSMALPASGQTSWGQECDTCTQQDRGLGVSPSWSSIGKGVEHSIRGARRLKDDWSRAVMYSRYPQITWGAGSPGYGRGTNVNNCSNCGGR